MLIIDLNVPSFRQAMAKISSEILPSFYVCPVPILAYNQN